MLDVLLFAQLSAAVLAAPAEGPPEIPFDCAVTETVWNLGALSAIDRLDDGGLALGRGHQLSLYDSELVEVERLDPGIGRILTLADSQDVLYVGGEDSILAIDRHSGESSRLQGGARFGLQLEVADGRLIVAHRSQVRFWDLSHPLEPQPLGEPWSGPMESITGLSIDGDRMAVAALSRHISFGASVAVLDISDPANLETIATVNGIGAALSGEHLAVVTVWGDLQLYLLAAGELQLLDSVRLRARTEWRSPLSFDDGVIRVFGHDIDTFEVVDGRLVAGPVEHFGTPIEAIDPPLLVTRTELRRFDDAPSEILAKPGRPLAVAFANDLRHAYVAAGSDGLAILQRAPVGWELLSRIEDLGAALDVAIAQGRLVVADRQTGLRLYDLRVPTEPRLVATAELEEVVDFDLHGPRLIAAAADGLHRFHLGDEGLEAVATIESERAIIEVQLAASGIAVLRAEDGSVGTFVDETIRWSELRAHELAVDGRRLAMIDPDGDLAIAHLDESGKLVLRDRESIGRAFGLSLIGGEVFTRECRAAEALCERSRLYRLDDDDRVRSEWRALPLDFESVAIAPGLGWSLGELEGLALVDLRACPLSAALSFELPARARVDEAIELQAECQQSSCPNLFWTVDGELAAWGSTTTLRFDRPGRHQISVSGGNPFDTSSQWIEIDGEPLALTGATALRVDARLESQGLAMLPEGHWTLRVEGEADLGRPDLPAAVVCLHADLESPLIASVLYPGDSTVAKGGRPLRCFVPDWLNTGDNRGTLRLEVQRDDGGQRFDLELDSRAHGLALDHLPGHALATTVDSLYRAEIRGDLGHPDLDPVVLALYRQATADSGTTLRAQILEHGDLLRPAEDSGRLLITVLDWITTADNDVDVHLLPQ